MYKLVSDVGRWSYLNGEMVFSNVVWIGDKDEAKKYTLIDENGEKIDVDINKCISMQMTPK